MRGIWKVLAVVAAWLILAGIASGGSIAGKVTNAAGQPLAGVVVTATDYDWYEDDVSTTTAADGSYKIRNVSWTVYLSACAACATPPMNLVTLWWDEASGSPSEWDAVEFDVGASQALTGYNFKLSPGYSISGHVRSAGTPPQPIANITVEAEGAEYGALGTTCSAADGSYTIAGLPPDDYTVWATTNGDADCGTPNPDKEWGDAYYNNQTDPDLADTLTLSSNVSAIDFSLSATYTFVGVASPTTGGTVTPYYDYYPEGSQVTVTAAAKPGYHFDHWSDGTTGTSTTVIMDADKTVTGFFAANVINTYTLSVTSSPAAAGSISLSPSGGSYAAGTSVTLTATAATGYRFDHWTGAASGTSSPVTIVTGSANSTATAVFVPLTYSLSTAASPAGSGSVGLNPAGGSYAAGTSVTLTATAAAGYQFDHWSGAASGTSNPVTIVTGSANSTATAVFTRITHTLVVTVSPVNGGTVSGAGTYNEGDTVTLTASPASGYHFDHWTGGSTPTNPLIFTISSDMSLTAYFADTATYTLTTAASPAEGGIIRLSPAGGTYAAGMSVTLTATAIAGYQFDHWEGAATGTANPVTITTGSANSTATAVFTRITHTLSVTVSPVNGGTVSGAGIYDEGATATLTASPAAGYHFDHWSDGSTNPLSVVMSTDKSITAYFLANVVNYTLTATIDPAAAGSVSLNPAGGTYSAGTTVQATANPTAGYRFDHWEGGGTTNPLSVTMDANKSVLAHFVRITHTLSVTVNPVNGGTVSGAGIYNEGDTATLTPTAASGYHFDHWSGGSTTNPLSVVMNGDKSITAYFVANAASYTLTATIDPAAAGSVSLNPAGGTYNAGTTVQATAIPAAGYRFDHWEGGGTTNPLNVTMDASKSVLAHFVRITHTLSVTVNPVNGGTVSGAGIYDEGTTATLTATAASGFHLDRWDDGSTTNPRTVSMSTDKGVTAYFVANPVSYTLTVVSDPASAGNVALNPAGGSYSVGTSVTATATAATGYQFDRWSGAASGTTNPVTVVMGAANSSLAAHFVAAPDTYTLTASSDPAAGGSISLNPAGGSYSAGTTVTATATAAAGYRFDHWEGGGTTNPLSVTMDASKSVLAHFVRVTHAVTVSASPTVGGTINGAGVYYEGTTATLTANPAEGYQFDHWQGGSTTNPLSVTVDSDKTVIAFFTLLPGNYTLSVSSNPASGGSVTLDPPGGAYPAGTVVTLTAVPATGYKFNGWNGAASGTATSVQVTMTSNNKTVTAYFGTLPGMCALSVGAQPAAGGTITLQPPGGVYAVGTPVMVTANPAPGYNFAFWDGGITRRIVTVLMDDDKEFTAHFLSTTDTFTLTAVCFPPEGGSVSFDPPGGVYPSSTKVVCTVTAAPGWQFMYWSGDSNSPRLKKAVTMNHDKTVKAHFKLADAHYAQPDPTPYWVDFQGRVKVSGVDAPPGDEIAVYSQGLLCGRLVVGQTGQYSSLHVYGDDPTTPLKDGATPGEALTFKIWDPSTREEYVAQATAVTGEQPPQWTQNGDSWTVDLDCFCRQDISLHRGWNLFSFGIGTCYYSSAQPPSVPMLTGIQFVQVAGIEDALASIAGKYVAVRAFDQNGAHTYDAGSPEFSDLDYLAPGYGYYIKVTEDCTLSFSGYAVSPQAALELHEGHNLVGCWADRVRFSGSYPGVQFAALGSAPPEVEVPLVNLFPSLSPDSYDFVRGFDVNGGHTLDQSVPDYSDLSYTGPGYGYWVKMKAAGSLSY